MKICVLGLDSATPPLVFADERLINIRRVMDLGVYGELQGVIPPGPVPGWASLVASQDPGSLSLYGCYSRREGSYVPPAVSTPPQICGLALWDQVAASGGKSILLAVPPNFPPRTVDGISVGCFLTPPRADEFTFPAALKNDICRLVGSYPVGVAAISKDKDKMRDEIFEISRKQWDVARWLLREQEWSYFHFVDIGLHRLQPAFWQYLDEQHPRYQPSNAYREVIPDYYIWLDEQVGSVLELLDDQTVLLLASASGAQPLEGGWALNQWLLEEGLLTLNQAPAAITKFDGLDVDWARTKAWGMGGAVGPIYINLQGREPDGVVCAAEYESFRDHIKTRLEALSIPSRQPTNTRVLKPNEIYRHTRGIAPDLLVEIKAWSVLGSIGHSSPFVTDLAQSCTPGGPGFFVLTAPNCPLAGQYHGASLLDMAPTLLDLAGYSIPESMQGHSLVAGKEKKRDDAGPDSDQIILDRLAGLGYI